MKKDPADIAGLVLEAQEILSKLKPVLFAQHIETLQELVDDYSKTKQNQLEKELNERAQRMFEGKATMDDIISMGFAVPVKRSVFTVVDMGKDNPVRSDSVSEWADKFIFGRGQRWGKLHDYQRKVIESLEERFNRVKNTDGIIATPKEEIEFLKKQENTLDKLFNDIASEKAKIVHSKKILELELKKFPQEGDTIYISDICSRDLYVKERFTMPGEYQSNCVSRGLVFKTKEEAIEKSKSMLK